jgi:hypothetical protein
MRLYVIYQNPADFPGLYVCRVFENDRPTREHWTGRTLDEVRSQLPADLSRLPRADSDDPVIVEVWV